MKIVALTLTTLLMISQAFAAEEQDVQAEPSAISTIQNSKFSKLSGNWMAITQFDSQLSQFLKSYAVFAFARVEQMDVATVTQETGVALNGSGRILTVHTSMAGIMKLLAHPKVKSVSLSAISEPKPAVTGSNQ